MKGLWIGQSTERATHPEGFYLYANSRGVSAFGKFLKEHQGHPLVFDDSEKLSNDYDDYEGHHIPH